MTPPLCFSIVLWSIIHVHVRLLAVNHELQECTTLFFSSLSRSKVYKLFFFFLPKHNCRDSCGNLFLILIASWLFSLSVNRKPGNMNKTPITYRQEKSHMGSMERSFTDQSTLQEDERMALSFMDSHTCGTRSKRSAPLWHSCKLCIAPNLTCIIPHFVIFLAVARSLHMWKISFSMISCQLVPPEANTETQNLTRWQIK